MFVFFGGKKLDENRILSFIRKRKEETSITTAKDCNVLGNMTEHLVLFVHRIHSKHASLMAGWCGVY